MRPGMGAPANADKGGEMSMVAVVAITVVALIVLAVLIALASEVAQRREFRQLARETEGP
jgi:hypothetical protein